MDKSGLLEHCRPKSGTRIASRKCQFWPICALKFKYLVRLKFSIFRFFIILNYCTKMYFWDTVFHCSSEGYQRAFCIQGFWQESKTIFQRPFSQLFGVAASADLLSSQLVVKLKQRRSQQRFCLLYPTLLSEGALSLELQSSFNWGSVH